MFYVTEISTGKIIAKSRSVNALLRELAKSFPAIPLIETAAVPATLPANLRLNYISR